MPLTDTTIRNLKPESKTKRYSDSGGLYLEVSPKGGKWWRLKYRYQGKEKRLALGVYPDVSLKEARDGRDDAKKLLRNNIDPSEHKKAQKATQQDQTENGFETIALEWYNKFKSSWSESHAKRVLAGLKNNVFPYIGHRPISQITAPELLAVLRRLEDREALETAHRTKQKCGQVFRYAVATGRAERDPSQDLKGALPPTRVRSHPSPKTPNEIAGLLRAIDGYTGTVETRCALRLLPLVFVRPGELRHAEWSEIDLEKQEWRIPADKMKMRETHIVPLSEQAMDIIGELQLITGHGKYLFPSVRTRSRPMSENTINAALRRLGYTKEQMTAHGFRSIASTLLNEQGWNRDWIERQLAHAERDNVRAAYNYAQHLDGRKKMMQA
ncbi:integrase [Solemya velum gill symbiont]|uniref:tyrosine-type recombinase/integrase n=1 Tax=Solemya velum gill symbiont TaxID=2340 RepID=UPI000998A27C|nr:integrase arm-type DNA-binding domain-containing protein [Solemya velum gill symbiont]OOZ73778.1 integrase [Solemya velum gill symbiont]